MTGIDIGTRPRGAAAELDELQALLDLMRRTPASAGAWVSGGYTYHCGSTDEVDAAAGEWGVKGRWRADGTQYRAQAGIDRWVAAVFIPPVPVTLAEAANGHAAEDGEEAPGQVACVTCGEKAPAAEMDMTGMITYQPGSRRGTHRPTCRDTRACTRRAFANGRVA